MNHARWIAASTALIVFMLLLVAVQRRQNSVPTEPAVGAQTAVEADVLRQPPSLGDSGPAGSGRAQVRDFWRVYQQATRAKQAGRWELAARDYQRALTLNPSHWDSLYYLGNMQVELGRFKDAERAYLKLAAAEARARTPAARAYSALGALYSSPGTGDLFDLKKADEQYSAAVRANGDESGSVLRLGEVAVAAGDTRRARDYLEAASRTNFKSVHARFLRGYLAWQVADHKQAATLFREAVRLTKLQKPPRGVLGEGDTRLPGSRAMVRPGQGGLFDSIVAELWHNRDTSDRRIAEVYARVERFRQSLPNPVRSGIRRAASSQPFN